MLRVLVDERPLFYFIPLEELDLTTSTTKSFTFMQKVGF